MEAKSGTGGLWTSSRARLVRRACCVGLSFVVSALLASQTAGASVGGPTIISVACNEVALENAITAGDASSTGAILNLTSRCTYTLTDVDNSGNNGPNGLPVVTNKITVNGSRATINVSAPSEPLRILEVEAPGNLVLNNLTIYGGQADYGGGLYLGDGAVATLNHVTLSHNGAVSTVSAGVGGGAYVAPNGGMGGGTLTVSYSVVIGNTAFEGGGIENLGTTIVQSSNVEKNVASCAVSNCGGIGQGGGISNLASLTVKNSRIHGNTAECTLDGCLAEGGGITSSQVFSGGLVIGHTSISNNTATCTGSMCQVEGGGIWAYSSTVLTYSPTYGNTASCNGSSCMAWGAGITNSGGGTMTLTGSSTVTHNTASAPGGTAYGGGLYNDFYSATLHVVRGSNVKYNTASATGGTSAGGGIYNANPTSGSVTLSQAVVTSNSPDQCAGTPTQGC
jgi:hypothetical protein